MIEIFKVWINSLLCLGIFTTVLTLIMPNSKLKKYIYSLLGIVTIVTVIYPVANLVRNDNFEEKVTEVLSNFDNKRNIKKTDREKANSVLKNSFKDSLKNDVINRLSAKGIKVKKCDIFLDADYNIEKIEINIEKIEKEKASFESVTNVVKYLNEEYDIAFSKISVIEEG